MEYDGKEKKVYKGIWIPFLCMIFVPAICFALFYGVFTRFTSHPQDIVIKMSLGFSGTIGFLFCMICLVCGFIGDLFTAFINRIKDTVEFFKPFSKEAFHWYFYQFKRDGGIIMWLFFLFLIAFAIIGVYGFVSFFSWYNAQ